MQKKKPALILTSLRKLQFVHVFAVLFATVLFSGMSACRDDREPPEKIDKLRSLGVASNPVTLQPSTADSPRTFELTVYAALPKGQTVQAEALKDTSTSNTISILISKVPDSEQLDEQYEKLNIFSAKFTGEVPSNDLLHLNDIKKFASLRYRIKLTAGSESEDIVGNVVVYAEGSPQLQWQPFALELIEPVAAGATASATSDTALKSQLSGSSTDGSTGGATRETARMSWFVTDGTVKDRRGKETIWKTGASGKHMVIATARGRKSGSFDLKVTQVDVK